MNKKRFSIFYTIYFSLIVIFIIALIITCSKLSSFISQYNEGIPETVSERFFDTTFKELDTDKIIEMSGISVGEFESDEDLRNFITSNFSGELSYTSISSSEGDDIKYIVKNNGYKLSTFTLSPDENGDYHPKSLSLHLPMNVTKQYRIFSGSTLTLNGTKVSDSYITNREPFKYASLIPEGVNVPEWITYEITGLSKDPVAEVTNRNGAIAVLTPDENGIFTEEMIYDSEETDITQRLMTASKEYAKCMQNDASKASVYPYFERGTSIYESIRTVETAFAWDHSYYGFEDESISEFMRYDENTVSARISFTHILKLYGKEDYHDHIDMTVFARNTDGIYRIFAIANN